MNLGSKTRPSDDARAKARALQRAKAAAAQRERVEKEMAKDAALIKAMEDKLLKNPQNNYDELRSSPQSNISDNEADGGEEEVEEDEEGVYKEELNSISINMEGGLNSYQNLEESMFSSSPQSFNHQEGPPHNESPPESPYRTNMNNHQEMNDGDSRNSDEDDEERMSEDIFLEKVTKIQAIFRGHIGRSLMSVRKDRDELKTQVMKAITIQSAIRRKLAVRRQNQHKQQTREAALAKLRKEKLQKEKEERIKAKPPLQANEHLTIIHKKSSIQDKCNTSPKKSSLSSSSISPSQYQEKQGSSPISSSCASPSSKSPSNKREGKRAEEEEEWLDDFEEVSVAVQAVRNIISQVDYYQ